MAYKRKRIAYVKGPATPVGGAKRRRVYAGPLFPSGQFYRRQLPVGPVGSRMEKKVSDIAVGVVQINTTGTFTLLHIPQLGTDFTNRIGRKTLIRSFYVKGRVTTEGAGGATQGLNVASQQARMILFCDLQPNGAVPVVTDLLNSAEPASHLNLNNRDRFKILKDKMWAFDPYINIVTATQAQASCSRQCYSLKAYMKLNQEVIFNATNGGTIADITSGALYLFWIGSQPAGAGTDANAIISTRVRYEDA